MGSRTMKATASMLAASALAGAGLLALALSPCPAWADAAANVTGAVPVMKDGAAVYQHVCQGCHMPDGKGAVGAATIPALAGNPKLASAGYPAQVIVNGYGGMPFFNGYLSDKQVADVVNYIRSHFGNTFTDTLTPDDVKPLRADAPVLEMP